jgi:hypothetical protein
LIFGLYTNEKAVKVVLGHKNLEIPPSTSSTFIHEISNENYYIERDFRIVEILHVLLTLVQPHSSTAAPKAEENEK